MMAKMARIVARAVFLTASGAVAISCVDNDLSNETARHVFRSFRLAHSYSDLEDAGVIRFAVHAARVEDILLFQVESFEAVDQSGNTCALAGAGVMRMKGGTAMLLDVDVNSDTITEVAVTARLRLNDDTVDLVTGFRRRTPEEKRAFNPDVEWEPPDKEKEEVTVSAG